MKKPETKYHYYEKDGAVFRGEPGRWAVEQVQLRDGSWRDYDGDRLAPVYFGNRLPDDGPD